VQLVLAGFVAVVAAVWPVSGATPTPLAAGYLTAAQCTKHVNSSGDWSNPATFAEGQLPTADDIVCINGSSVLSFNVASATVVGIVSATDATLYLGPGGGTLTLSGGPTADQASTIGHLFGAGATLVAVTKEPFPTIITFLDSCLLGGPGDYKVTQGGAGGFCSMSGTGSPSPLITLAANMTPTSPWELTTRRLVIEASKTLTVQSWGINLQSNAAIENHGVINLAPGASDVDPSITALAPINSTVENKPGAAIVKATAGSTGVQRIEAPVVNDGMITNSSPGTLVLGGPNILAPDPGAVMVGGPGPVSGSGGTFSPRLVHDDGTLAPGHSPGSLTVNGDYTINTGLAPVLSIEIASTLISQWDSLNVTAFCNLGGMLSVTLLPGYTPAFGDTFTIVSCGNGRFGEFAIHNLPTLAPPLAFEVLYGPNTVTLHVTSASAATFRSFTASRARAGVLLRWRTGTEVGLVGFNVYRQRGAKRLRLNRALIAARGGVGGASYSWLHRRAAKGGRYWLQTIDADGSWHWYGGIRFTGD